MNFGREVLSTSLSQDKTLRRKSRRSTRHLRNRGREDFKAFNCLDPPLSNLASTVGAFAERTYIIGHDRGLCTDWLRSQKLGFAASIMAARTGSIPGTPVTPGKLTPFKRFTRVNLRFKLPYMTVWGQNLMVVGSDPIFGSWNIKQGIWMTPHHEGDVLVWQAFVSVPEAFDFEYRYCLVDEKLNVLKWEAPEKRKLAIPEGLADGAVVDILDNWQVTLKLTCRMKCAWHASFARI